MHAVIGTQAPPADSNRIDRITMMITKVALLVGVAIVPVGVLETA